MTDKETKIYEDALKKRGKKKKTYVLTVSERFPQTHSRAGEETGFIQNIILDNKIHTIRSNYDLWQKRVVEINAGIARLSVRVWEGKPYRSKQREVIAFNGVGIEKVVNSNPFGKGMMLCIEKEKNTYMPIMDELAKNDGLSLGDFVEWFKDYDLTKPMAIIHFTYFRYSTP